MSVLHPKWMKGCAKCEDCGRTVHDFIAPDDLWIEAYGGPNGILCYDCFCERLAQKGLYSVFELREQADMIKHYRGSLSTANVR